MKISLDNKDTSKVCENYCISALYTQRHAYHTDHAAMLPLFTSTSSNSLILPRTPTRPMLSARTSNGQLSPLRSVLTHPSPRS